MPNELSNPNEKSEPLWYEKKCTYLSSTSVRLFSPIEKLITILEKLQFFENVFFSVSQVCYKFCHLIMFMTFPNRILSYISGNDPFLINKSSSHSVIHDSLLFDMYMTPSTLFCFSYSVIIDRKKKDGRRQILHYITPHFLLQAWKQCIYLNLVALSFPSHRIIWMSVSLDILEFVFSTTFFTISYCMLYVRRL